MKRLAYAVVFMAWVLPRIIPLLFYPGVYSFDAWTHIGYVESILTQNHIPLLNPIENPYTNTPFLHIFACLIYQFFGLSLIDSFRIYASILVVLGFLAFFTLFRSLFGDSWQTIIAMLIFSLDVDVLAQTNCVIPENFALTYLALIISVSIKSVKQEEGYTKWIIMMPILLVVLVLSHQLTSLFGLYFAFALLLASVVSLNSLTRKIGTTLSLALIVSLFGLLILSSPLMVGMFGRYFPLLASGLVIFFIACGLLWLSREKFWNFLRLFKTNRARQLFLFFSCIAGIGFLASVTIFYPYDRPILWTIFKFGLFSCLLGLSISVVPLMPWVDSKTSVIGLFIVISTLVISLSFSYTSIIHLLLLAIGQYSLEVGFSHRHFAFLIIPFAIMSTIAILKLRESLHNSRHLLNRLTLPAIMMLLITFSIGGIYNLYSPIGGWYPEWCKQSEIDQGLWLREKADNQALIVTDGRLIRMMYGMFPRGTTRFDFLPLNQLVLENPMVVFDDPSTYQESAYFMTSDLMEANFILEFLVHPITLECSNILDRNNFASKIYDNLNANIYWLAT